MLIEIFRESAFIFAKFLTYLGSLKIKNSGYPPEAESEEDKIKYCQEINEQMNFEEDCLKLNLQNVEFNSIQRSITKEALNSILGKMSQGKLMLNSIKLKHKIHFAFQIPIKLAKYLSAVKTR